MDEHFTKGKGRKLMKGKGGLRMVAIDDESKSPFEIDEPQWLDDSQHPSCMKCKKIFSFTSRRHHCRRCGRVFCSDCCKSKVSLPRLSYVDPERICQHCMPVAKAENIFFTKHLKVLTEGALFVMNDDHGVCECKLHEKAHSKLIFKNKDDDKDAKAPDSVLLKNITSIENITDADESNENVCGKVLKITEQNQTEFLKLTIQEGGANKEKSTEFLEAIQKAMELLFDVQ